jgi:hypothetical protein
VRILQAALARDRRGEYQIQAAIAALHDDARTADETDWPQILAWCDELLQLTDNPVAALSRAVAVGEASRGGIHCYAVARREDRIRGGAGYGRSTHRKTLRSGNGVRDGHRPCWMGGCRRAVRPALADSGPTGAGL